MVMTTTMKTGKIDRQTYSDVMVVTTTMKTEKADRQTDRQTDRKDDRPKRRQDRNTNKEKKENMQENENEMRIYLNITAQNQISQKTRLGDKNRVEIRSR